MLKYSIIGFEKDFTVIGFLLQIYVSKLMVNILKLRIEVFELQINVCQNCRDIVHTQQFEV